MRDKIGSLEAIALLLIIVLNHVILSLPKNIIATTGSSSLLNIIFVLLIIIPLEVFSLSTTVIKEKIDTNKETNLTLYYNYEDYNFDNTLVKIYNIASITPDFKYELTKDFINYQVKINGIKTIEEWDILEQTLNSYIEADKIKEMYLYSIKNNEVKISNLKPGLYFIKTEKINNNNYIMQFNDFLINIPFLNEEGTWNYNIESNIKVETYTPKYEDITYTVIKEWKDNSKNRPKNIDIEIYKDGVLFESKTLSSNNNWSYSWDIIDDGSKFTVVEKNIEENYQVSIIEKNNFKITFHK